MNIILIFIHHKMSNKYFRKILTHPKLYNKLSISVTISDGTFLMQFRSVCCPTTNLIVSFDQEQPN